jgi:hypothetical protein
VVVRSKDTKRVEIAGTGWWGSREMNPEYVGVEASPDLVEKMRGHGAAASGTDAKPKVTIERARLWHIARYARGFWAPTIVALLAAAAAIAGVVVSLVSAMLAPGIVLGAWCQTPPFARANSDLEKRRSVSPPAALRPVGPADLMSGNAVFEDRTAGVSKDTSVLGVIALVALTEFAQAVTNIAAAVRKR